MYKSFFFLSILFAPLLGSAQNILHNPSFETSNGNGGVQYWHKRPTTWQANNRFYDGNNSYRLDADFNEYTFYSIESDSILVGREYELTAWTKTIGYTVNDYAYWRYVNLEGSGVQVPTSDLDNPSDTNWTKRIWDFYPLSGEARLDIFWKNDVGNLWIDSLSMHLKERTVAKIHSLPEPWRLNIGDDDTCTVFVELHDVDGERVSNSSDLITFTSLDPTILTLISPASTNAVFGKATATFVGSSTAGIGRIEIQSGVFRDTLWISNREKLMPDDFFHIGTMLYAWNDPVKDAHMIEDLDSLGMNIVFTINGPSFINANFMNTIQNQGSALKVIAQTNLINAGPEDFFEPQKNWNAGVAKANEYYNAYSSYDTIFYGYRLYDEPNYEKDHHTAAFHSNLLYAADPSRQAITIDAWDFHLTERNMRIRNNDFKLTYHYPFNEDIPVGVYPFEYGQVDSEVGFDSISRYDDKPWYHMVQSYTMDLPSAVKRWPEAAEMKQQAYSAVSFGAKGIYYFFYQDLVGHPQEIRGLIEDGYPTVHRQLWQPAKDINWNLRNNQNVFINGVHSANSSFVSGSNTLLRMADFELDEPNGKYVMLVNKNALDTTWASINIEVADIDLVENKFSTGGQVMSFNAGVAQVKVHPGDAMLLQFKRNIGIEEYSNASKILVYPNPAQDYIRVDSEEDYNQIIIANSEGKTVFSQSVIVNQKINIKTLASGTYVINILNKNHVLGRVKFIKMP